MPREEGSQGTKQERDGAEESASRNRLGCGIGRLLGLFFGLAKGLLVLLLVLFDLSLGLIVRNVLSLGESISSLLGRSRLLGWISRERRTNRSHCRVSKRGGVLPSRGTANLILDRAHRIAHVVQGRRGALHRRLNGPA